MKIARHSVPRHADDTFACAVLIKLFPNSTFIASRDPKVIETCDIVVDVGGQYDPEKGRFDHHQKGAPMRPDGTPYSAFGLVWRHYGLELCGHDEELWSLVDESFVRTVDAWDNGIPTHQPLEGFRSIDLSMIIGLFNPSWMEDDSLEFVEIQLKLAVSILERVILKAQHKKLSGGEEVVREALSKEKDGIVVLDRFAPWQDIVVNKSTARLVIYPPTDGGFNVQAVPVKLGDRKAGIRATLPPEEEARAALGDELKFVHKGRFIGGAHTLEGAIKLARMASWF